MENGENTGTTMDLLKDIIAGMAIQTMGATQETSSMTDTILDAMCEIARIESDITSQALAEARNAVSALSELLLKSPVDPFRLEDLPTGQEDIEISNSALESLQKLSPLVPEEKREEFEEIVAQEKSKEHKLLTIENLKWLISIIIAILVPLFIHHLDSQPSESEKASMQFQEEFIEKFQKLIDVIESQSEQPAEVINETNILCMQFLDSADSVDTIEQIDDQAEQN